MTEPVRRVDLGNGFQGLLAPAAAGAAPTVVLLHSWFGLTGHFRELAVRLADAGLTAVAVDLFDGEQAGDAVAARQLRMALSDERALAGARAALALARQASGSGSVGVLGFSMGGELAIKLAVDVPEAVAAVVVYYGICVPGGSDRLRVPVQAHLAAEDEFVTPAEVADFSGWIEDGLELHSYPGTRHAFSNASRPESYNPRAAELAWRRTVIHLRSRLIERVD
jgi:carboxymethylenebutenolidase